MSSAVGQVVPQPVGAHQQPTRASGRDRVNAGFRPRLGSESAPSQRVSMCAPACTASESAGTPAEISSRATESSTVSCCAGAGGAGSQYTLLSPTLPTAISTVPVAWEPLPRRCTCTTAQSPDPCPSPTARGGLRRTGEARHDSGARPSGRGERGHHRLDTCLRRGDCGGMRIAGGGDAVTDRGRDRIRSVGVGVTRQRRRRRRPRCGRVPDRGR